MNVIKRIGVIGFWIWLVLVTAVSTAAIKQRFAVNNNHALKMRLFNQFKDVRTVSIASVLREARVPRHVTLTVAEDLTDEWLEAQLKA